MTTIEMLTDVIGENMSFTEWLNGSPGWIAFFTTGTAIYIVIRSIRKTTGWLTVKGR